MAVSEEDERVLKRLAGGESDQLETDPPLAAVPATRSPVAPFVVGTVIGGVAGTIVGTALSPYTRGLFIGLYHVIQRRMSASERDQLRFELLLQ